MDSHNMKKTLAFNSASNSKKVPPPIPARVFDQVAGFDGRGGYHGTGGHGGNQIT